MQPLRLFFVACAAAGGCSEPEAKALADAAAPDLQDSSGAAIADRFSEDGAEADSTSADASSDAVDAVDVGIEAGLDVADVGSEPYPPDGTQDAAATLCGCTAENAVDRRATAEVTVAFSCCTFAPKCLRISAGATLRFLGNFVSHPFSPSRENAPGGPLTEVSSGGEAAFAFPLPGSFGYYCTLHGFDQPLGGMCGAVLVDP